jgi:5-methyltetrahydropteroyltriglutamate--homocysteine methyltransferase
MSAGSVSSPIAEKLKTANLGFPRMGRQREMKFALEGYWTGKRTEKDLFDLAAVLRAEHWKLQQSTGIDFIPSNDFSLYDQVLDALVLIGATPERFGSGPVTLDRYFAMARNSPEQTAMEMTKWFDTNYHYLVPEWSDGLSFKIDTTKLLGELKEARNLGIETRPVLVGPLTLLLLGKGVNGFDPMRLLPRLTEAYEEVLRVLIAEGVLWVQIDEPMLATDFEDGAVDAYRNVYAQLTKLPVKLMLATYFDSLASNLQLAVDLGTAGIHIDVVRGPNQLNEILSVLKPDQMLSIGCVEGRNIWLTDFSIASSQLNAAVIKLGAEHVIVAPSCSLLHVPHDLQAETKLDTRVRSWLRFAAEKLAEIVALAQGDQAAYKANTAAIADRAAAESTTNPRLRAALAALEDKHLRSPQTPRCAQEWS